MLFLSKIVYIFLMILLQNIYAASNCSYIYIFSDWSRQWCLPQVDDWYCTTSRKVTFCKDFANICPMSKFWIPKFITITKTLAFRCCNALTFLFLEFNYYRHACDLEEMAWLFMFFTKKTSYLHQTQCSIEKTNQKCMVIKSCEIYYKSLPIFLDLWTSPSLWMHRALATKVLILFLKNFRVRLNEYIHNVLWTST